MKDKDAGVGCLLAHMKKAYVLKEQSDQPRDNGSLHHDRALHKKSRALGA